MQPKSVEYNFVNTYSKAGSYSNAYRHAIECISHFFGKNLSFHEVKSWDALYLNSEFEITWITNLYNFGKSKLYFEHYKVHIIPLQTSEFNVFRTFSEKSGDHPHTLPDLHIISSWSPESPHWSTWSLGAETNPNKNRTRGNK